MWIFLFVLSSSVAQTWFKQYRRATLLFQNRELLAIVHWADCKPLCRGALGWFAHRPSCRCMPYSMVASVCFPFTCLCVAFSSFWWSLSCPFPFTNATHALFEFVLFAVLCICASTKGQCKERLPVTRRLGGGSVWGCCTGALMARCQRTCRKPAFDQICATCADSHC